MEHTINVRIPANLWAEVREMAINERRSATAQLAVVVERGLAVSGIQQSPDVRAEAAKEKRKTKQNQPTTGDDTSTGRAPLSEAAQRYMARQEHYNRTGEYPSYENDE